MEKFIVLEIQTNSDGNVGNLVYSYDLLDQAYNKFYTILAFASISSIPIYTVMIVSNSGIIYENKTFTHLLEE